MPISKIFLPDINVWIALASRRHIHSEICSKWLKTINSGRVIFCRVSQMGLLRLLTTESVMGSEALSSCNAWRTYQTILTDERISFESEPLSLEAHWRKLTNAERPAPKVWTDAYLSAFAQAGGMRLVTLDRAVRRLNHDALILNQAN